MDRDKRGRFLPGNKANGSTPEAQARKRSTQFGQPGGNTPAPIAHARAQRDFYKWVESEATEEELRKFMQDETKPYGQRRFIQLYTGTKDLQDMIAVTNQVHGAPKQVVEVQDLPTLNCQVFGKD